MLEQAPEMICFKPQKFDTEGTDYQILSEVFLLISGTACVIQLLQVL
jgi:hypothetical protein